MKTLNNQNDSNGIERWIIHYEEIGFHDIVEAECKEDAILQASLEYTIEGVWYYDTIYKEDAMKHTKGKWYVSKSYVSDKGIEIAIQSDVKQNGVGEDLWVAHLDDTEETKANANLIASAPEMLETLKQLRFDLSKDDYYKNHAADIDSIIAKAEGK